MQVGLFDHVEHGERPLAPLFDERLQFAAAADEAGIYCLHVAEHHATPLNMVPVPGVYLGALARATKRMRLGPLVYLLPLYSPLRLIEEICMLDHLSHGRLEIGVGRGVSPFELKLPQGRARPVARDLHRRVRLHQRRPARPTRSPTRARTTNTRTCRWRCGRCSSRIRRSGTARPTPPARPGRASTACISSASGRPASPRATSTPSATALAKRGGPAQPKPEFSGGAAIGVLRHIFVAETDEEAKRFAKPAMERHLAHLNWLRNKHGDDRGRHRASTCRAAPPSRTASPTAR